MAVEQTFLMVKPDGVQRGLIGEIVSRFENKGFKLVNAKMIQVPRELAESHYAELSDKPFFGELVDFITSSPVFGMIWEGENVITTARAMMGATNPSAAAPGTIRNDYAISVGMNIIHGSDSPENAAREIGLWFGGETLSYDKAINKWI
ncbi:nucleoside-diphosphate kinase [Tumebacillus avium]|uniref:Nucleoside diphosphate kinase n=1 Tax=Tumebacillus avium TaxID=1903704 RepID=A0A1Y0IUB7_9BACL|nr:nucleoside-diphosphate kinase [Tumebacillus avium]ARU62973.1 nucleoside-diphosphate kinase [Tumebacillus avium]